MHHHLANSLANSSTSTTEYASSTSSSRASSPRSGHHHSVLVDQGEDEDDDLSRPSSEDLRSSVTYSDAYDSSADSRSQVGGGRGRNSGENPLTNSTTSSHDGIAGHPVGSMNHLAVDHLYSQHPWSDSSRVSSRAASPVSGLGGDGFDGYLSYRAGTTGARLGGVARSRSGFSTPTTPAEVEEKDAYDTEYEVDHHVHQSSALLDKLSGAFTPDTSPIIGRQHSSRKPSWWQTASSARRVDSSRRKTTLSSSSFGSNAPLLGTPSTHNHHYRTRSKSHRETLSASSSSSSLSYSSSPTSRLVRLVRLVLRQPYVPTQPVTILFSILLFLCFAATLTTFLMNVLSSDREPLPWRQFCQEQRPFPHALADSLKPVNVFVGVFSVDAAVDRRNAIRLSYAKHSKPIDPLTGRPGQNVQVKFVLGRPREKWSKRIALEMEMFNDIVVLDVAENMNKGKTFAFFKWANENATVPVYYHAGGENEEGKKEVGVGFKKVDYVVKADDDAFIVLSELERHLRLTPRENTYWGYLIRNRFMGGEVYALSSDLVNYLSTYPRPASWTIGKEDQRVAAWMRNHPNASSIHWITERCYIYDHPKAGTTYARGFTFPDHVEQVRLEGRRGISEQERLRRGGELWQSYSTVQTWKKPYQVPAQRLSIEEQVEALVEGGGRWNGQGWRSDNGRGPQAVKYETVVFGKGDKRMGGGGGAGDGWNEYPDSTKTGVRPGVPDINDSLPSARTTRFGKDLFRDPDGVEAVQLRKRSPQGGIQEGPTRAPLGEGEYEIFNLARGPFEDEGIHHSTNFVDRSAPKTTSINDGNSSSFTPGSSSPSSSSSSLSSSLSPDESSPTTRVDAPINEPTGQIRFGHHAYTVPYTEERFVPAPSLRYDPSTLALRQQRMLGLAHGGTVAVHYLKRNEWFYETALALLGREKMWDSGSDTPAFPDHPSTYSTMAAKAKEYVLSDAPLATGQYETVEILPPLWGSVRMYGSPIVTEEGAIVEGRRAEAHREVLQPNRFAGGGGGAEGGSRWAGRFTSGGRTGMLALAEMEGVEIKVGDRSEDSTTNVAIEEEETASAIESTLSTQSPSSASSDSPP
ncbi:uncharacterized protein JCM6883_002446 [Sporobolomyces salmoneus]|uniref:uncharacterized protein n=1 Tax=Sporobolomyces salmoneus TaxID=183962 RepID=UPI0031762FD3